MSLCVLALCVAAHAAFNDDPLAPSEPAPPVLRIERVVRRGDDDERAHASERRRHDARIAERAAALLRQAKPADRNVIVAFASPQCQPCAALLAWLHDPIVVGALSPDYAIVGVAHQGEDADDLCALYAGKTCAGYPVIVVVDKNGTRLAPSWLGYPENATEAAAFVALLLRHAPHVDANAAHALVERLTSGARE